MDSPWLPLLRIVLLFVLFGSVCGVPAMNALKDENRLDDGGRVYGPGVNVQDTSTPERIVTQAYDFLERNLITGNHKEYGFDYSFSMPSSYKYGPSQWLWDSGAHQILWARKDIKKAIADIRGMLSFQLCDGRIPEMINWHAEKQGFLAHFLTRIQYSHTTYNDLTQIPVLPYSLRAIYEQTNDTELLREIVPKLIRYFDWWKNDRDVDGNGLVTILHPWESGIDLSPAYDPALGVADKHRARPTWKQAYSPLINLVLQYNFLHGWNQKSILSRKRAPKLSPFKSWFRVQDIAVNCVYASGWGILGDLASKFDPRIAEQCYRNQNLAEKSIIQNMYDSETNRFHHLWHSKDGIQQRHPVKTIQTLFPLLLSSLPTKALDEIVRLLEDENEFGTGYMIPTVAKSEKEYNPVANTLLLWRGPIWGFTNWFIIYGLEKHGKTEQTARVMAKWIEMVMQNGIWEHYNPETGKGYGAEGLGMSCLIVDWMARLGIVEVQKA